MTRAVVLDASPLGLLSHPAQHHQITAWMTGMQVSGELVVLPEIADYEVRRELLRAGKAQGIQRLNWLRTRLYYQPITTHAMGLAADYWAQARQLGQPTAHPEALDGDVILAAQATVLSNAGYSVVVATSNPGHLARYVDARPWQSI